MASDMKQTISPELVNRVKGILLKPKEEWEIIEAEPQNTERLLRGYVLILAAIGPVCRALGSILFGYDFLGVSYHPSIVGVLVTAFVSYLLAVGGTFVFAFIVNSLAPTFDGTKSFGQALKVAAYAGTASMLAGVFGLNFRLAPLSLVGLYSLYLLYLGLPPLMKAPKEKALAYTGVIIVVGLVLGLVIGVIMTPLHLMGTFGMNGAPPFSSSASSTLGGGQIQVGGATVDVGKLQAASNQIQAQAQAIQSGATAPSGGTPAGLTQDQLKSLLPDSIAGLTKGEVESTSAGTAGLGATNAQAVYSKGDEKITVEVTDMSSAAGLGAFAAAMNVNSSKETPTGYEKVTTVNGRVTSEDYDRSSKHGKFSILTGGRLMVQAEGDNVSIDDLKAAVQAVGPEKLDALAHHS